MSSTDENLFPGNANRAANGPLKNQKDPLLFVVSLVLVIGFVLTSMASYLVSRTSLRRQIVQYELPLTRDSVYSEVQRDLLQPVFLSSMMANDAFVRKWVLAGEQEPERMIRYLAEIQREYGTFTAFFVSESTRVYYQAEGILKQVKEDEERDVWYFRVREMTQPYEINVDPDMANEDAMTIFINYRVFDFEGNYIGATGVGLTVYAVSNILERYQREYGCTVFFADHAGRIMLRSANSPLAGDHLADIPGLAELAGDILDETSRPLSYQSPAGLVHVNTRYIDELGWFLIALQSEEGTVKNIRQALLANLGVCALITALVLLFTHKTIGEYRRRIEKMAATDSLTGLPNRLGFNLLYEMIVGECHRRQTECAMLLFDLDHFKKLNDTHGHLAGDAMLRALAGTVRASIRASDVLCRWGGEEFIILLRDCPRPEARCIAETIRVKIAELRLAHEGSELRTTASFGIAMVGHETQDHVLKVADRAMYRAKDNGRNRVEEA